MAASILIVIVVLLWTPAGLAQGVQLPCTERVRAAARSGKAGEECGFSAGVTLCSERACLVGFGHGCRSSGAAGGRDPWVWKTTATCYALVDPDSGEVLREVELGSPPRVIGLVDTLDGTAVWEQQGRSWVLGFPDGRRYRWAIPAGADVGFRTVGRAVVLDGESFPRTPLRVALRAGEGHLVTVWELHAAEGVGGAGGAERVADLLPLDSWRAQWRRAARLEEDLERLLFRPSVWQRLIGLATGIDWRAEMEKRLQAQVEAAPTHAAIYSVGRRRMLVATDQPFTLGWLETKTGKLDMIDVGELKTSFGWLGAASHVDVWSVMTEKGQVWVFATADIAETVENYARRHGPKAVCPARERLPGGEEMCLSMVDLLLAVAEPGGDSQAALRWWVLAEGGVEQAWRRVLRVKDGWVRFLEVERTGEAAGTMHLKRRRLP